MSSPASTKGSNFLGGSGGMPPRKFCYLDAWKCYFQCFPGSIWALKTIKIKCILTIFYLYCNHSFPQNLNQWLLGKSKMINLQIWIKKSTFNVLSSCCPLRKRAQLSNVCLFWRGSHFDTCESLGSSTVKMSQAFHDP